jgi:hypothetical protein
MHKQKQFEKNPYEEPLNNIMESGKNLGKKS